MRPKLQLPSTKAVVSTAASAVATVVFLRSFARDYVPIEIRSYFHTKYTKFLLEKFSNEVTLVIDEYFEGLNKNRLFAAAELHVAAIAASSAAKTFLAAVPEKETNIHISVGSGEEILDNFHGFQLKWKLITIEKTIHSSISMFRKWQLSFDKKHRSEVVGDYLPYILESLETLKREKKTLKLHTNDPKGYDMARWQSVNLDHPSVFETLAMDEETKRMIVDDLDSFLESKEFYRVVGKTWKRGYLLHGPPGTGKSSLIAAMANYLKFDVYNLELSCVKSDQELRQLLISAANKSILVVEDIDASIDLPNRKSSYAPSYSLDKKVTLSGLLNIIDGLWSSVGDERIIIFTTNYKERLDDALLRPGRMDVHIHMSYCTPRGLRLLANKYLGMRERAVGEREAALVTKAEELIGSSEVTPAEVGEQLLKSKNKDPELALEELVEFLEGKARDYNESLKLKEIISNRNCRFNELMKKAKALPKEKRDKILSKDEVQHALKVLIGFIENTNGCDLLEEN